MIVSIAVASIPHRTVSYEFLELLALLSASTGITSIPARLGLQCFKVISYLILVKLGSGKDTR
jgi:hypothetical protein